MYEDQEVAIACVRGGRTLHPESFPVNPPRAGRLPARKVHSPLRCLVGEWFLMVRVFFGILIGIGRVFCWFNLTLNTDHVCIEGTTIAIIRNMPTKKHTAPIRRSIRYLRSPNNIPAMTANDMAIPTTIILGMGCLPIRDAL